MAPQNESDPQSGTQVAEGNNQQAVNTGVGSVDMATNDSEIQPFSEHDPFRTARIDTIDSQTRAFLQGLQVEPAGLEAADDDQLKQFYQDVKEREGWSEARTEAFQGVLRLARPVPPRSKRIL